MGACYNNKYIKRNLIKLKKIFTQRKGAKAVEKKKKAYESPELEVIEIALEDIVTASLSDKEPDSGDIDEW